jgi:hypothetical protein
MTIGCRAFPPGYSNGRIVLRAGTHVRGLMHVAGKHLVAGRGMAVVYWELWHPILPSV